MEGAPFISFEYPVSRHLQIKKDLMLVQVVNVTPHDYRRKLGEELPGRPGSWLMFQSGNRFGFFGNYTK
jgi:hypothetical protein